MIFRSNRKTRRFTLDHQQDAAIRRSARPPRSALPEGPLS
jgi:hypothetical protein